MDSDFGTGVGKDGSAVEAKGASIVDPQDTDGVRYYDACRNENNKASSSSIGYQHASFVSKLTFWFVNPLIRWGARREIGEHVGMLMVPETDTSERLHDQFSRQFSTENSAGWRSMSTVVWITFIKLYKWSLLRHSVLAMMETGARIAQPIFLRHLLDWYGTPTTDTTTSGWVWAALMAVFAYLYVLIHHQTFWTGMRMGMRMRCQMIAQIQDKVLRMNGASLAGIASGKIINLVSNDVRRFDEAGTFWVFLIAGPLELVAVFCLVGYVVL